MNMNIDNFDELVEKFKPQASAAIKEFEEFVNKNFDQFDRDGDGFLSASELEAAIHDENRTMKEVGFLTFLLTRIHEISEAVQEEGVQITDCISRLDLKEYFSRL